MLGCCVPECKNRSKCGYRLFSVPTTKNDDQRRNMWLDFIKRGELPTRDSICEVHFNDDQFEMNRKDNQKLLKNIAIPTQSLKRKLINDKTRNLENETSLASKEMCPV